MVSSVIAGYHILYAIALPYVSSVRLGATPHSHSLIHLR
jgi:hypothetical protein